MEYVNLVLDGMLPSEVSLFVPESRNTIASRVKTANGRGFDALHTKKLTGHPSKLGAERMNETGNILLGDDPEKYGYHVWDGPGLSGFISRCSV